MPSLLLFISNNLLVVEKGYISGPASIFLLGLSRMIPNFIAPIFKIITIPLTLIFNLIDRVFFKDNKSSASVYFILQKKH